MLELYFIFYRIPKMMSRLAKERQRSAVKWSLAGIAAWIVGELFGGLAFGVIYALGMLFGGWPEELPPLANVLLYVVALASAIGSFALVRRILTSQSATPIDSLLNTPPPPPSHF